MDNVIQHVKIEDIVPRNHQYNLSDIKYLEDLAISIKEEGIKEPLRLKKSKDKYEIIEGNRRYRAAILAGLTKVPAIIEDYDYNKILKYITGQDNNYPKSIDNNSDVVNLSELSKEYERDDFKMNNELMNNNTPQPVSTQGNVPTFGGRFFPSLEDEPTNMSFNTTIEPSSPAAAPISPTNNYIDLTDTSTQVISSAIPEQPQNSNPVTPQQEMQPNMYQQSVIDMNNGSIPNNNSNVLSIESLTQNNSIAQPIQEQSVISQSEVVVPQQTMEVNPTNIDNNFQEIATDFQPNSTSNIEVPPQPSIDIPTVVPPVVPEPAAQQVPAQEIMMNNSINIPQDIIPTPQEQPIVNQMPENISVQQPEQVISQTVNNIPNIDNSFAQPVMEQQILQQPEIVVPQPEVKNQVPQKDITPVINTIKAVGVNLENFGYTIRITDEDLPTSYKITIEVEK